MATILRIKRSSTAGNPSILAAGELAYSSFSGAGGNRLYIGTGNEVDGDAVNHVIIGGQYFTDMLDHTHGTLTASSALIVDTNKKIDEFYVDDVKVDNNEITTSTADTDLKLSANGATAKIWITKDVEIDGDLKIDGGDITLTETATNINLKDNNASALVIKEGSDKYLTFDTTNNVENILLHKDTTVSNLNATANAVSYSLSVGHSTSGEPVNGIGTGIRFITQTAAENSEVGVTIESSASNVTAADEKFNFVVKTMTAGAAATQALKLNNDNLTIGANNTNTTIQTQGTGDLVLKTGSINTGSITIKQGDNGNINFVTHGNGVLDFGAVTAVKITGGSNGNVLTTNGSGVLSWAAPSTALTIAAESGANETIDLLSETLTFEAGEGINTTTGTNKITIAMELATAAANVASANIGGAAFDSGDFDVSVNGFVSIKTGGVANSQLENSSLTVGTTSISLGGTSTTLAGLTQVDVDQLRFDGNTISSTNVNGNITLDPNGNGVIDVSSSRITNVSEPVDETDAATKKYVDAARSGLDVKQSVKVATTTALIATYDNGTVSVGGTLTNNGPQVALEIDGIPLSVGNRVLVKDQPGADAVQNGIYTVTTVGDGSTNWVLTRATDSDNLNPSGEVTSGMFCFVETGTLNSDSGFVLTTNDPIVLGSTELNFTVFSTSGTLVAGAGLSKDGYTLKVNVATDGGIEINSDNLQLKSTVAGNGLTYANGIIAIGGTADRITVSSDSIDISTSYIGQTTITTLGTIATGTWQGTAVAATYGGTGQTSYTKGDMLYAGGDNVLNKRSIGTEGQVLQVTLVGSDLLPTWAHLDGGAY